MELIIHIDWHGPFSLATAQGFRNRRTDFGLYQVYAEHPVYGRCLVYIGKAADRTFGHRLPEHAWDTGSENDPDKKEIYLGRLKGPSAIPEAEQWRHIDLAQALLIHSHGAAYNSHFIKECPSGATHGHVRILNWGAVRSLHREVSGLMWTNAFEQFRTHSPYVRPDLPVPPAEDGR